jgi:hypothetical protein
MKFDTSFYDPPCPNMPFGNPPFPLFEVLILARRKKMPPRRVFDNNQQYVQ